MAVGPSASPSSSSVTTSATTSSQSSSTSVISSSGHGGTPFSANGTAALILAFLAIGLFVGGMVAMIGLRRRALERAQRWMTSETPSPVWAQDFPEPESPSGRGRSRRRKKKDVGTPPKLYDVYAPSKGLGTASWWSILPLSVKAIPEDVHSTSAPEEPEDVSQSAHTRWHFDALGFFHWAPGPSTPSPVITPPQVNQSIEVAVVIAMPSPADESSPGLDYSLGLTQAFCHGVADLYDLNSDAPADYADDATTR